MIQKVSGLLWRTGTLTALVALLAMTGLTYFLVVQLHLVWHSQQERRLIAQAETLANQPQIIDALLAAARQDFPSDSPPNSPLEPPALLTQSANLLGATITLLDAEGRVFSGATPTQSTVQPSSQTMGQTMGQTVTQSGSGPPLVQAESPTTELGRMPEVRSALATGAGVNLRGVELADALRSQGRPSILANLGGGTVQSRFYFVAVAVRHDGELVGLVRLAVAYAPIAAEFTTLRLMVIAAGMATTLVLCALIILLAERRAWKLRRLTDFAQRVAKGTPDAPRLHSINRGELVQLAHALNRTADRLRSQTKKRAREKDRLITIMHVMTDGVIILNKSGRVRLLNPAAERILNTTHERALDRTFVQTARDHRIAEVWERCQQEGNDAVATVELPNNQFVRIVVTPFLKRTARGYLVILQDLTEVRRLQTVRQDFVSNVSHELRTPLASLRALVETLRDSAMDDPPAAQRFLDRMEVEVDALTEMVSELLELSRIESGQVPLRLSVFSPEEVLGIGAERLRPQTERAEIALSVCIPADLPEILVDSGRIQQVVTNLVHNAIKFTPPGGKIHVEAYTELRPYREVDPSERDDRTPTAVPSTPLGTKADSKSVSKSTEPAMPLARTTPGMAAPKPSSLESTGIARPQPTAPHVVLKVQDTGLGISENELARIFERFYKTDRSRAVGGTGLGLAISKHIIQAHGGEIWAESDGKSGSAFYFALPPAAIVTAQQLSISSTALQEFTPLAAEMVRQPIGNPQ